MENLLTSRQAADYFQVSESTIRRWKRAGRLPYVRYGTGKGKNRTVRYRLTDLRAISDEKAERTGSTNARR
jgi:excisionase family DNA binding protein